MPDTHVNTAIATASTLADLHRRWLALSDEINQIELEVDETMMNREHLTWPRLTFDEAYCLPEYIRGEIDRANKISATIDLLQRCDQLKARLAEMEKDPARFEPARRAAMAAYEERDQDFLRKADRHGLTPRIARLRAAEAELDDVDEAIRNTPPRSAADIAALLDIALDAEYHTPSPERVQTDWPQFCLLTRRLHELAPGFEFAWLRHLYRPNIAAEVLGIEPAAIAAE